MATQTFNFDQTDEDPFVDANFTQWGTNSSGKIVSNQWTGNVDVARTGSFWNVSVTDFGDDQSSQVDLFGATQGTVTGPGVRMDASGNGYALVMNTSTGNASIVRYDALSANSLASAAHSFSSGQTFKIVAEGSTITGYVDDVQVVQTTDSTYTSGQPGFVDFDDNVTRFVDNWEGSDELTVVFTLAGDNVFSDFSQSASATGALSLVGQNVFDDLSQSASAVGALNLSGANTFNDLSQSASLVGAVDLIGQNIFNDFSDTATIDVGRVLIGQNTFDDFSAAGVLDNTSFNHFIATCVFSDFSTDGNLVRPVVSVAEKRKVSIPATSRQITIEG